MKLATWECSWVTALPNPLSLVSEAFRGHALVLVLIDNVYVLQ